jgi:hypothetical protein
MQLQRDARRATFTDVTNVLQAGKPLVGTVEAEHLQQLDLLYQQLRDLCVYCIRGQVDPAGPGDRAPNHRNLCEQGRVGQRSEHVGGSGMNEGGQGHRSLQAVYEPHVDLGVWEWVHLEHAPGHRGPPPSLPEAEGLRQILARVEYPVDAFSLHLFSAFGAAATPDARAAVKNWYAAG